MSVADFVYLNQIFFFVPFLASFSTAALIERFGARLAIFTGLLFALVRNCSRALLFSLNVPGWHQMRFVYWALQRLLSQVTVALYYCLPLRLAESWFSEEERSLALSLMLVTPVLGSAAFALSFPHFVHDLSGAHYLAAANMVAATLSILAVVGCVRRSKPGEGAPSERNQKNLDKLKSLQMSRGEQSSGLPNLFSNLSRVLNHKHYLIQVLTINAFDPLIWTIQLILQDIFVGAHLTPVFCGQFLALSTIFGATMQISCSFLWRSKRLKAQRQKATLEQSINTDDCSQTKQAIIIKDSFGTKKCKVLLSIQCATFLVLCHTLIIHELYPNNKWLLTNQWWLLICAQLAFISVRNWAAPYYNEQSAELICGRISEPFGSACSMISSLLLYNVISIIFVQLRRQPSNAGHQQPKLAAGAEIGKPTVANYTLSILFQASLAMLLTAIYLLKFDPILERRQSQGPSQVLRFVAASNASPESQCELRRKSAPSGETYRQLDNKSTPQLGTAKEMQQQANSTNCQQFAQTQSSSVNLNVNANTNVNHNGKFTECDATTQRDTSQWKQTRLWELWRAGSESPKRLLRNYGRGSSMWSTSHHDDDDQFSCVKVITLRVGQLA